MSSNNFNFEQQRTRGSSRLNIMNIANNANNKNKNQAHRICLINNHVTIDRIARITTPQITSNPFENDFFNGASFHCSNSLESSILPTGCLK